MHSVLIVFNRKKTSTSVLEFVKHFRAHLGNVQDIALNHNGTLLATVSNDKMAKIFDVVNFDMINIIKLGKKKSLSK